MNFEKFVKINPVIYKFTVDEIFELIKSSSRHLNIHVDGIQYNVKYFERKYNLFLKHDATCQICHKRANVVFLIVHKSLE